MSMQNRFEGKLDTAVEAVLTIVQNFKRWRHMGSYDYPALLEALEVLYDADKLDSGDDEEQIALLQVRIDAAGGLLAEAAKEITSKNRQLGAAKTREKGLRAKLKEAQTPDVDIPE